mmetsp:Transcript_53494/g.107397  ORF Transcript_53494/g.107397 Transcript_53494/m.107397 type:complete len:139 (-) Transcript_53494:612-1028(-)
MGGCGSKRGGEGGGGGGCGRCDKDGNNDGNEGEDGDPVEVGDPDDASSALYSALSSSVDFPVCLLRCLEEGSSACSGGTFGSVPSASNLRIRDNSSPFPTRNDFCALPAPSDSKCSDDCAMLPPTTGGVKTAASPAPV